jgi:glycosyltransferase involved in cell wall biosynthesis
MVKARPEPAEAATASPRVSVVMAVHNGARYVRLAIDSVLAQDFQLLELVIVDDGSTDETPAIIGSYADDRIVYVRNDTNIGQTRSLNVGLSRARAEYISRIDADDIYLPGKLSRQYALMVSRPDVAVCGTAAIKIDADGRPFGTYVPPIRSDDVRFVLCQRVPVCHVSVMMRRAAILDQGGYDERYRYAADYALWSMLARSGLAIVNLDEPLMLYREFVESLGAVHKLGTAGDESAEIIRGNIATLAGITLSVEECRAIALLYFQKSDVGTDDVVRAYLNLAAAARAIYGRTPARVRIELATVLCWSLLKRATERRADGSASPASSSLWKTARTFARYPMVQVACLIASLGSRVGSDRVQRMKEIVMPMVLRRLR